MTKSPRGLVPQQAWEGWWWDLPKRISDIASVTQMRGIRAFAGIFFKHEQKAYSRAPFRSKIQLILLTDCSPHKFNVREPSV